MKSKREQGKTLEYIVADYLKDIYPYIRPSKGSGNSNELGDIAGIDTLLIECKYRNTKNITIKEDVWNKLYNELPINSKRVPIYVLQNKNKKIWVALELKDFMKIFKESKKKIK